MAAIGRTTLRFLEAVAHRAREAKFRRRHLDLHLRTIACVGPGLTNSSWSRVEACGRFASRMEQAGLSHRVDYTKLRSIGNLGRGDLAEGTLPRRRTGPTFLFVCARSVGLQNCRGLAIVGADCLDAIRRVFFIPTSLSVKMQRKLMMERPLSRPP